LSDLVFYVHSYMLLYKDPNNCGMAFPGSFHWRTFSYQAAKVSLRTIFLVESRTYLCILCLLAQMAGAGRTIGRAEAIGPEHAAPPSRVGNLLLLLTKMPKMRITATIVPSNTKTPKKAYSRLWRCANRVSIPSKPQARERGRKLLAKMLHRRMV
jgi:hypothetical protein